MEREPDFKRATEVAKNIAYRARTETIYVTVNVELLIEELRSAYMTGFREGVKVSEKKGEGDAPG